MVDLWGVLAQSDSTRVLFSSVHMDIESTIIAVLRAIITRVNDRRALIIACVKGI